MTIQKIKAEFCYYSLHIRGYSKATIKRYDQIITLYCRITHIETMEEITVASVHELFFTGRTERNWKPNTARVFHKTLNVFFNWCIAQGYMQINPMDTIEVPKLPKALPRALTKQDAINLLDLVQHYPHEHRFLGCRNHAIFATFIYAGLRRAELLNLRYGDVDLESNILSIRQGKGNKDRVVPISPSLSHILRQYVAERKRLKKTCPAFFASLQLNVGFTDHGLKHLTNTIRTAAKRAFTIHQLRHTFATLMLEGGCDIYSLSKMMGHTDIKTTTIYLAATTEHLRGQIAKHPLN